MDDNDIIYIAVEKYEGKEIIFTRQKLEQKKGDHPELLKKIIFGMHGTGAD